MNLANLISWKNPVVQSIFMITIMLMQANGLRYPRWGGAAGRRPTGEMLRRRKRLGIAPESPASGARFVGWRLWG